MRACCWWARPPASARRWRAAPLSAARAKTSTPSSKARIYSREELYVTNAVKFRPTRTSAAGRTVNRPPTQEEIRLFAPWLRREIALVDPQCVVTLGNVPLRAVTEKRLTIGDVHGQPAQGGGPAAVSPLSPRVGAL